VTCFSLFVRRKLANRPFRTDQPVSSAVRFPGPRCRPCHSRTSAHAGVLALSLLADIQRLDRF
jgi:hypothetical protein